MHKEKLHREPGKLLDTTRFEVRQDMQEIDSVSPGIAKNMQLAMLQALTDPAIKHLALDDLFQVALSRVRDIMEADNIAILLLTDDKKFLSVRAVLGLEECVASKVHIPLGEGFAGRIAAQGMPLIVNEPSEVEVINPILQEHIKSLLGVPLIVQERVIGVMHIGMKRAYAFTQQDIHLFENVAHCLAQAIEHTILRESELRAQIEAAQRLNFLETIIETITDGMIVYDQQGRMVQANSAARLVLGMEVVSDSDQRTAQERVAHYTMSDGYGQRLSYGQLPFIRMLRGEILAHETAMDIRLHTPDNRKLRLNVSGAPLRDADGNISGAVCMFRDVTAHRQLEKRIEILDTLIAMVEALLETPLETNTTVTSSEISSLTYQVGERIIELAQHALDCSHICMFAMDQYTRSFHLVAIRGYSLEQERHFKLNSEGTQLNYLLSNPATIGRLEDQEILAFEQAQSPLLPHGISSNDRPLSLLAPISTSQQLLGLLGITFADSEHVYSADDMTLIKTITKLSALAIEHETKSAENDNLLASLQLTNAQVVQSNLQLEQINKGLNDFIMTMGHEFRTALTGIQGFSELLCEEDCSKEDVKDYATDIQADAQRLSRMVNGLLDLERMKAGKMTLHLDTIDLNSTLADIITRVDLTTEQHSISLQLDETLPALVADRDKIVQVMYNLMSNAIKYSPAGGSIIVSSKREKEIAHVSICDHGVGIPEDALEKIFIPYNRLERETTRYVQGTGLGLSIVRQIIELHGGHAWAESKAGGSCLHFTLPLKCIRQPT